nr:hypothetical protein [Tanacetum cinerariifolium]
MGPHEAFACRCGAEDVVLFGKIILDVNFFMERETSPSTGQFSWSFNDSKLFSKTFIEYKLFSRTFNTSKLFLGTFKKWRVLKVQDLAWKDKDTPIHNLQTSKNTEILKPKSYIILHFTWWKEVHTVAELREAAQSNNWVEMLVLYCWRSVDKDFKVAGKTSEFLKETQEKDDERLQQLKALARETEARAREKCIFIEKLKGNQPFKARSGMCCAELLVC